MAQESGEGLTDLFRVELSVRLGWAELSQAAVWISPYTFSVVLLTRTEAQLVRRTVGRRGVCVMLGGANSRVLFVIASKTFWSL